MPPKSSSHRDRSPSPSPPPSPLPEKKKRTRVEKSEESRQAMLKRLEEGRKKALEARQKNKEKREMEEKEYAEKVEKVDKLLKNEDIFEKKYRSHFDKIVDKLEFVESHIKEEKEYKTKKRSEKAKPKEPEVKPELEKRSDLATASSNETPKIERKETPNSMNVSQMLNSLPDYRTMKFGRNIR